MKKTKDEVVEIDLLQLLRVLWKNAVLIILVGAFFAVGAYLYTAIFVSPTYRADIMVNVNSNASRDDSKGSVSTSEISASKSLVSTYIVILTSRTVLNEVIEKSGVKYSYERLSKMVSGESVSSTEILKVKVTSHDPAEAALIANTIAEVLPSRISEIVIGSSAVVVDYAVEPKRPTGPHKTRNAAVGFIIGAFLIAVVIVVRDMLDDTVRDEAFLTENFNIPLLASIPDLGQRTGSGYSYSYSQYDTAYKKRSERSAGGTAK